MKKFWNLFSAQNNLFFREKQAVFWNFLFPLSMIIFFGMIFGSGGGMQSISLKVGLVNRDNTPASEVFVNTLKMIPILKIDDGSGDNFESDLSEGKLNYILIIPSGFKHEDNRYRALELKYDPKQVNTNRIGNVVFDQIIYKMNEMLSGSKPMITLERTAVESTKEKYRYIDWFVPGILSMSLLASALFGIGVVITEEREKGQLRRYAVAPVPKSLYIGAQLLQRFFVAILQALVIITVSAMIFNVKMKGSWFLLFVVLCIGLLAFSAIGYAVAARIKKAQTAAAVANILFMPMIFLSGVYFPLEVMPSYLRPIGEVMPLAYMNEALRMIFSGTETISGLLLPVGILSIWLVVCFVIAVKTFIWE